MTSIPIQLDNRSLLLLAEKMFPLTYVLAIDGEHSGTIEIVPGIAVEVEPAWMWFSRQRNYQP